MRITAKRTLALAAAAALVTVVVTPAAFAKGKSIQTEAEWISFDATANTIEVKIKKPGRGDAAKALKRGKPATFDVKPTGSVLTRTTVAVNGKKDEITNIPAGKTVNIYWVPNETNPDKRFARKIDVIFSEAELEERYGADME